ncbi:GGDEF domain-containing protein [Vibrio sp.]|uniref:GGDEF domain-containing protein n=1 Tax=Vibrio sp. TaxID=678 RepID=UPI003D14A113
MKVVHKSVIVLVVLTIAAIQIYNLYGDKKVYRVSPERLIFLPTDDRYNQGTSTATMTVEDDKVVIDCVLRSSPYPWPYCGISIHVDQDPTVGLDLSNYHTARINIDFANLDDGSQPRMRFYLRNYNPEYSVPDNEYTHKYNGLEYQPGVGRGAIDIPINHLQVMTWWLADNSISIDHSGPEYSRVNKIEFASGSAAGIGRYRMTIHSIELVGSYIQADDFFLLLLGVWVSLAIGFSVNEIRRSRRLVMQAHSRHNHLKTINDSLRAQNIQFAELAHRDALTGAMNRHSVKDWFDALLDNHYPRKPVMSILYLDLDHFKRVNDDYGHSIGDDILREFTMVVLKELDSSHKLVRWGGEEFVAFCPNLTLEQALDTAEKIRRAVEQHFWVHGDPLTTSIGVAQLSNERLTETLARADDALYNAKGNGRNRVESGVAA